MRLSWSSVCHIAPLCIEVSVPEQGGPGAQYFARYAEPEARLAAAVTERYAACLVVPACAEEPSLLDGFEAALSAAPGRVLFLLVVNAADSASRTTHDANRR